MKDPRLPLEIVYQYEDLIQYLSVTGDKCRSCRFPLIWPAPFLDSLKFFVMSSDGEVEEVCELCHCNALLLNLPVVISEKQRVECLHRVVRARYLILKILKLGREDVESKQKPETPI